jgi:hypothetical protein
LIPIDGRIKGTDVGRTGGLSTLHPQTPQKTGESMKKNAGLTPETCISYYEI